MSKKQERTLEIISKFIPKDFGIRKAYYKVTKENIELVFIIDKDNAGSLISYLNVLPHMIEKRIGNIKIESSVYINGSSKKFDKVAKEEELESMKLPTFANAGMYA